MVPLDIPEHNNLQLPERPIIESNIPVSRNMFHRCPVPPIGVISPDNLTQFTLKHIPQFRIFIS